MAISTVDGAIGGIQQPRFFIKGPTNAYSANRPSTLWGTGGIPGAGSYDTTLNGVVLSSTSAQVNGQIPFADPVSGNTYLTRFVGTMTTSGSIILADRLWHNGGYTITSTSAQNSTSPTWPARDVDGATSGNGVYLALEISAAVGAATPSITISYTNSSGTSGRSAVNVDATLSSANTASMYRIALQAGDTGVRSVESLTLNASWVSGTMNLVAYRPIAMITNVTTNIPDAVDMLTGGFPQLFNGTVPYLFFNGQGSVAMKVHGSVAWTQG